MAQPFSPAAIYRFCQKHWTGCFTIVVLALVAAVRIRLLDLPLERDEGEYAYVGQLMLHGIPPYDLAYTMKFPGTAAMYALGMSMFGQTTAAVHLLVMVITTATALMLFRLGSRMFDPVTGMVAATTYAVMAASPAMLGLAGHATHFAAFFVTAGLWALGRAEDLGWKRIAGAGVLFGLAVLMKQHAVFIVAWAGLMVMMVLVRDRALPVARRISLIGLFGAAVLLPFAACCLVLWRAGVFDRFWFWTVDYSRKYEAIRSLPDAILYFRVMVPQILSTTFCFWLVAGMVLIRLGFDRAQPRRWWLVGLGLASALAVVPGFYFRPHYFLLMLPAVALLVGRGVVIILQLWQAKTEGRNARNLPVIMYALLLGAVVFNHRVVWFLEPPAAGEQTMYDGELFPQAPVVAQFLRTHSSTADRVAVLGSEPEIYFLADRRSATGYIYMLPLLEKQSLAQRMMQDMFREVETNTPAYIVWTRHPASWGDDPMNDPVFARWWTSYRTGYDLVGLIENGSTQIRDAASIPPEDPRKPRRDTFEIFRRKDR